MISHYSVHSPFGPFLMTKREASYITRSGRGNDCLDQLRSDCRRLECRSAKCRAVSGSQVERWNYERTDFGRTDRRERRLNHPEFRAITYGLIVKGDLTSFHGGSTRDIKW